MLESEHNVLNFDEKVKDTVDLHKTKKSGYLSDNHENSIVGTDKKRASCIENLGRWSTLYPWQRRMHKKCEAQVSHTLFGLRDALDTRDAIFAV